VSHVEGDVGTAGGEGGHAAGGDAVGELLKGRGCDGFGRFGFGIAVVDDVAAVAGRVVIALYEAGIDGWEVSGEGDGDGGAGKFASSAMRPSREAFSKLFSRIKGWFTRSSCRAA